MSDRQKATKRDIGEALDLLFHMVGVIAKGRQPSREDNALLRDLINQIKNAN